ncbi:MAG: 50S ribosomal protein L6 [Beijerinckiaceae bacterium]|nr:50S ribosomal protein L6 [Beijerinckiaceae bacterium]
MSRIGKKPVILPSGVTARVEGQSISVKGSKGELSYTAPDHVNLALTGGQITVAPRDGTKAARTMWGMTRALVNNLVTGVSKGFDRKLEINGVGYKAAVSGKTLQLSLGYSHDISFPIPPGITIVTPKPTEVLISGIDKRQVGQTAAEIRAMRPPEPYKGKGIKYSGEFIFRKEGKKK